MNTSNKICDMHTHTVHSDGSMTPTRLVDEAVRAGISAIALTDHNTVTGLPEFLSACEQKGIIGVPGVEFSTDYNGIDMHLIALFVKNEYYDDIENFVAEYLIRKVEAEKNLIKNLRAVGFDLDYDEIASKTPDGYVNRAHIALKMIENGYVSDIKEAFDKYLCVESGFYTPAILATIFEVLEFIKNIGAVPVLAHPLLQLDEKSLRALLDKLVPMGLVGMEVLYGLYSPEQIELSRNLVNEYGILESGGSDFHGDNKPKQKIGKGENNISIDISIYENLKNAQK